MADIVIRGMEMPETCGDCPLSALRMDCKLTGRDISRDWMKRKIPDWCPLVPLPEGHGRLIDADAFKAMCLSATKEAKPDFIRREDWLKSCAVTMSFCRDIDERPTIVPAEGGKNE